MTFSCHDGETGFQILMMPYMASMQVLVPSKLCACRRFMLDNLLNTTRTGVAAVFNFYNIKYLPQICKIWIWENVFAWNYTFLSPTKAMTIDK